MKNNNYELITQRVIQNNQEFLLGVFSIEEILKFTRYTEYTILGFDEDNDNRPITKEEVQRKLNPSKVNSIVNFLLNDPLAIFPTNIVVSIPNHVIENIIEEDDERHVLLYLNEKVITEIQKIDKHQKGEIYLSIIDGQHRVRGIERAIEYLENEIRLKESHSRSVTDPTLILKELQVDKDKLEQLRKIELPVTFFIDPVLEYQAMIFSTINRTQTKVPPNLVYSLFGLTKGDSPQKSILNIVNTLNGRRGSPFYKRIKLAGSGSKEVKEFYKEGNPVLSQSTVIKLILKMICKNSQEEENARNYSRKYFIKNPDKNLPFRKYYGNDEDEKIIKILYAYFDAVRKTFIKGDGTSYWEFENNNSRKPNNILQTTVGFNALIDILNLILINERGLNIEKVDVYKEFLIRAKEINFSDVKSFSFNNRGKKYLYLKMSVLIWPPSNNDDPRLKELFEIENR